MPHKPLPPCPVATTVELIGNKWKLLILRDLMGGTAPLWPAARVRQRHQPKSANTKPA